MKFCKNCGNEIIKDANFCLKCGFTFSRNNLNDASSKGFPVLSFFFPIVGLILWLAWNKTPMKAKSCRNGALAGLITGIVIFIVLLLLFPVIMAILHNALDNSLLLDIIYKNLE